MDIRRLPTLLILLSVTTAVNAAHKDEAYYAGHPDQAAEKYAACQNLIETLAREGKIAEMMQVAEDPECKAANETVAAR